MHVSDPSLGLEEAAQAADGDESDEQLKQRALEQAKQAVLKNQQRTQQFDQKVGHAATDDSDQVCLLSFLPALLPSFFLSWVCLPVGVAFFFFFFFLEVFGMQLKQMERPGCLAAASCAHVRSCV